MSRMSEKTADPALPLEGAVSEAQPAPSASRAVAAHKGQSPTAAPAASPARSEHQALLDMISAAAANPKVNVDKMKALLEMRNAAIAVAREDDFNIAMAEAQAEMRPVIADAANKETGSKYASHAALDRAVRPIYTKHGFALSYDTEPCPLPEMMTFVCFATAKGHTRKYTIDLPVDGKGPKGGNVMSRTHAASSGVTYAMRILLKMVFNLPVDRDDDGNAASRTVIDNVDPDVPKISQKQIDALIEKCESVGCPRPRFLQHIRAVKFEDIPAADFDAHMTLIGTFKRAT